MSWVSLHESYEVPMKLCTCIIIIMVHTVPGMCSENKPTSKCSDKQIVGQLIVTKYIVYITTSHQMVVTAVACSSVSLVSPRNSISKTFVLLLYSDIYGKRPKELARTVSHSKAKYYFSITRCTFFWMSSNIQVNFGADWMKGCLEV